MQLSSLLKIHTNHFAKGKNRSRDIIFRMNIEKNIFPMNIPEKKHKLVQCNYQHHNLARILRGSTSIFTKLL